MTNRIFNSAQPSWCKMQILRIGSQGTRVCPCKFGSKCLGDNTLLTAAPVMECTLSAINQCSVVKDAGDLAMKLENNILFEVKNVLFCEDIDGTILSVKQRVDSGYKIVTTVKGAHLYYNDHLLYCVLFVSFSYQFHSTKEYTSKEVVSAFMLQFFLMMFCMLVLVLPVMNISVV